jgi:hypothetical protein
MKKIPSLTVFLAGFLLTSGLNAQVVTIWDDDFTPAPTIANRAIGDFGSLFIFEAANEYTLGTYASAQFGTNQGAQPDGSTMRLTTNGQHRAWSIALDPAALGATAGDITITFDVLSDVAPGAKLAIVELDGADADNTVEVGMFGDANGIYRVGSGTPTITSRFYDSVDTITTAGSASHTFSYDGDGLIGFAFSADGGFLDIDNLRITGVPEPSTYALLAGALAIGLVMFRRRK